MCSQIDSTLIDVRVNGRVKQAVFSNEVLQGHILCDELRGSGIRRFPNTE